MSEVTLEAKNKKPKSSHVRIRVTSQNDGASVFIKIRRTIQLRKMMEAFCERKYEAANTYVFLFKGDRIKGFQTPDDLEMEDEVEVDAMLHANGGSAV